MDPDLFAQPSSRVDTGLGFPAKYPGICGDCDEEFDTGTMIRYADAVIVHAHQEDCLPVSRAKVLPCNACFLEHAGECF